jgi:BMFP domain-containing protein YqiC
MHKQIFKKECRNMAKAALKKTTKPAIAIVKRGRRPSAATAAKVTKTAAPVKKPAPVKAAPISKDELRAQLEKAQNTIATLRTKNREAVRAVKLSAAQIAELEAKVAQLEKKLNAQPKPAKPVAAAAKPAKRQGRKAVETVDVVVPVESEDLAPAEAEAAFED